MLATLLTFQVASAGTIKKYGHKNFPHPQVNLEECNLSAPGWICDPDHTLSRDQADRIAEMLGGSATEVPALSLLILNDDDENNFGRVHDLACELKSAWLNQVNLVSKNDSEMQFLVQKGSLFMGCTYEGAENQISFDPLIRAETPEDMIAALDEVLPKMQHAVDVAREKNNGLRWWHSMQSCATCVSLLLATMYIFYLRSPAQRHKTILNI